MSSLHNVPKEISFFSETIDSCSVRRRFSRRQNEKILFSSIGSGLVEVFFREHFFSLPLPGYTTVSTDRSRLMRRIFFRQTHSSE